MPPPQESWTDRHTIRALIGIGFVALFTGLIAQAAEMVEAWGGELEGRRRGARRLFAEAGCDLGLIFGCDKHGQAFRYLTNFEPLLGDMWLLLGDDLRCFLTFQWQIIEARALSGIDQWDAQFDPVPLVVDAVRESGVRRVGAVGLDRMPMRAYQAILTGIRGLELVDLDASYALLRRCKSPFEIELLREAARLTDEMLDAERTQMRVGARETEIAAALAAIPLSVGGECAFVDAMTPLTPGVTQKATRLLLGLD